MKTDWKKAHSYSIKLSDEEQEQFERTGLGVKKIFKAMLDVLSPPVEKILTRKQEAVVEEEE